jgi:N4-gp56 family major capsid protein
MANFYTPVTPQTTITTAAVFIPEIWSDEIIAAYEANLILAGLVRKMSMKGKKGDTIHVPIPTRGTASAKVSQASVTLIADSNTELQIIVNQHYEYSRMIEDIADVQAISSLRRFYTEDAGYALANQVDKALFNLGPLLGTTTAVDAGTTNTKANWALSSATMMPGASGALVDYVGDATAPLVFLDATMRDGIQLLDDKNVPMSGRFFAMCPALANDFRGIDRYSSSDFVNSGKVPTGQIGDIYGVTCYQTTNVPQPTGAGTVDRMNLLGHKDCYVLAEQVGIRSQTQYQQPYLSTLFTADRLYGKKVYRGDNAITIATLN